MKIEVSSTIPADPSDVFAYIADFENNARWQSGVVDATRTTSGDIGVGTRFEQVSSFLGRRIESSFEVTAYTPGERIRYETTDGTFPIQVTRAVEPHPDGAQVNATIEGDPTGVFSLAAPVLDRVSRRRIRGDYEVLRTLFEIDRAEETADTEREDGPRQADSDT